MSVHRLAFDCKIENCDRPHKSKGFCNMHYLRWFLHDDPYYEPVPYAVPNCSVEMCNRKAHARGYCNKHYTRWKKTGTMSSQTLHGEGNTSEERFWNRVALTSDDTRCWLWLGTTSGQPAYGTAVVNGIKDKVHRLVWILTHGKITEDMWILHSCDTPLCVNPKHLREGTPRNNVQDREERNRGAKGKRIHPKALDASTVRNIRQSIQQGLSVRSIGKLFGVHEMVVSGIKRRRTYKWVT